MSIKFSKDEKEQLDRTFKVVVEDLRNLYIDVLPTHVFYDFMEKTGKIGGATKFPRVLKGKRYEDWKEFISSLNSDK